MKKQTISIEDIDVRLRVLEDEKTVLLALRRMYEPDEDVPQVPVFTAPAVVSVKPKATPVSRAAPSSPLIIPTGATAAILQTVAAQPGIRLGDLIDAVLKKVPPTNQMKPRKNIANITGQLVVKGRLIKNVRGGFNIPQEGS